MNHPLFQAIEFTAPSSAMPPKVCELLSELAAEAWIKACMRWQATQESAIRFASDRQPLPGQPAGERAPLPIFVARDLRP
jgi:hypothetical protein